MPTLHTIRYQRPEVTRAEDIPISRQTPDENEDRAVFGMTYGWLEVFIYLGENDSIEIEVAGELDAHSLKYDQNGKSI